MRALRSSLDKLLFILEGFEDTIGNRWVISWLVIDYIWYSMNHTKSKIKKQDFFDINVTIQALFIHDYSTRYFRAGIWRPPWSIFSRGVSHSQALVVEPDSDQIVTVLNSRMEIFYPVGNLLCLFLKKASDSNSQESKTDNSAFLTFRFIYFSNCPKNKFDLPFCFR